MSFKSIIYQVNKLNADGNYKEAKEKLKEIDKETISEIEFIQYYRFQSKLYSRFGDYDQAIDTAKKGITLARKYKSHYEINDFYTTIAHTHFRTGKFDDGLDIVDIQLKEIDKNQLGFSQEKIYNLKSTILTTKGVLQWSKGNLDAALITYQEALEFAKLSKYQKHVGNLLGNIAIIHSVKHEHEIAIKFYYESLEILEAEGLKFEVARTYINLGQTNLHLGEIKEALRLLTKALQLHEELELDETISATLQGLGDLYLLRGDMKLAQEQFQRSLDIKLRLGNQTEIARTKTALGLILISQNKYEEAFELLTNVYDKTHEIGNPLDVSNILYELIQLVAYLNKDDLAKDYLRKLELVAGESDEISIKMKYQLVKAFWLKTSDMESDFDLALKIFKEEVNKEMIDIVLSIFAILNYTEMLVVKLNRTLDPLLLGEIERWILKLSEIAQKNQSYTVFIESLILQAKMEAIHLKLNKSEKLLSQALFFAKEKEIYSFDNKIKNEQRIIQNKLLQTANQVKENPSLIALIKEQELQLYIRNIIKGRTGSWGGVPTN